MQRKKVNNRLSGHPFGNLANTITNAVSQAKTQPPPFSSSRERPSLLSNRPATTIVDGWWENAFSIKPTSSELRGHPCGKQQMLTLVGYDITDHKRLTKIARCCENYGVRIQYSVFECRLEAQAFDQFWNELLELIDPETDRLVAYKICLACAREVHSAGLQIHHEKVVAYIF